jgi:hypothetical protein
MRRKLDINLPVWLAARPASQSKSWLARAMQALSNEKGMWENRDREGRDEASQ